MPATWIDTRTGHRAATRWLRRLVLRTSVPPLLQLYRVLYRVVAWWAGRSLWKLAQPATIYLSRGCAGTDLVPGISDIDFVVITHEADKNARERIRRRYRRLAARWLLLDPEIVMVDAQEFRYLHQTNRYHQFRIEEGRNRWRHLRGPDLLPTLPLPSLAQRQGGMVEELKVWWAQFAARVLMWQPATDPVAANGVAHKATFEMIRLGTALQRGELPRSRHEVELQGDRLVEDGLPALARVQEIARSRFWREVPGAHDDALSHVLHTLDRVFSTVSGLEVARPTRTVHLRADATDEQRHLPPDHEDHAGQLTDLANRVWKTRLRGVHRGLSVHFDLDERILLLELAAEDADDLARLREFSVGARAIHPRFESVVLPYLLLPDFALQMAPQYPCRSYQSILAPATHPDLYDVLARSRGTGGTSTGFAWSALTEDMFSGFEDEARDVLNDPLLYKLDGLSFLRTFWKLAQLSLVSRAMKTDDMCLPLSVPAIVGELERCGHPLPVRLTELNEHFCAELAGQKRDFRTLVPEAVTYLREIARCE